ncbi:MAG: hypothetical protein HRF40_10465 [Nitrososphaera sp.]|jgi:hypothetical protein
MSAAPDRSDKTIGRSAGQPMEVNEFEKTLIEWCSSTLTGYTYNMTMATVTFSNKYYLAAFLWSPFYFMGRRKE